MRRCLQLCRAGWGPRRAEHRPHAAAGLHQLVPTQVRACPPAAGQLVLAATPATLWSAAALPSRCAACLLTAPLLCVRSLGAGGQLLAPCACTGAERHIHQRCLLRAISAGIKAGEIHPGRCTRCEQGFTREAERRGGR